MFQKVNLHFITVLSYHLPVNNSQLLLNLMLTIILKVAHAMMVLSNSNKDFFLIIIKYSYIVI